MPYQSTEALLRKAQENGYAVGAFNVENMEMAQAVVAAAEALHAPVILQTTPGTLKYAPPAVFAGMISHMAKASEAPVALHLDHGSSFELAQECYQEGYTSLMIDGSLLPFEENIALSQRVVMMAKGLPIEAELGTVGGKEDDHEASNRYTDPDQAEEFVKRTGIASFAPAIGTAHGVYKAEPKLDLDRLRAIREKVSVPLVLHGTSGVPDDAVRQCIRLGVCKVNYATDLRITFTKALREAAAELPNAIDPKKLGSIAREAVKNRVMALMRVCGCEGRA